MTVGSFAFVPNLRSAAAADATLDGIRPRLTYQIELLGGSTVQGGREPLDGSLKGPGDVVGIDPGQIIRIEPEEANKGFEPNYFPFVQFRDPDLPWRYSLDSGQGDQLTPWVSLIVLKRGEFTHLSQGSAPCPRIEVASIRNSLPDLGQAWAWGHVQVDMNGVSGTPQEVLLADPGRGFARLLAPRQLEQSVEYTLFLVPTYKVGLDAGLGREPDPSDGPALAWAAGMDQAVILPVYFRHSFKTEAGQDLETLLRELRAIRADEADEPGAPQKVDATDVGYYPDLKLEDYAFKAQAALRQVDQPITANDTPAALRRRLVGTLNTVLAESAEKPDEEEDPLLTFPAYGARFGPKEEITKQGGDPDDWFDGLNLDLRFRAAAGLGHDIVRANDEHFAQLAWEQYEDVLAANQSLRQLQAATLLAGRMEAQHFSRLPQEAAVQLSSPLLGFVRTTEEEKSPSIARQLSGKALPEGYTSLALRRSQARKPSKAGGKGGQRRASTTAFPGDETPSETARPGKDGARTRRAKRLAEGRERKDIQTALRDVFNVELLGRKPKPRIPEAVVGAFSSQRIKQLVGDKLTRLPRLKADHIIGGRTAAEKEDGGIIWRAPRIPDPLIDYLIRVNRDGVLSNVAELPENTISFYQENRHFLEALMVGANHAMNEELRWRGYPTDMRGTIFSRFWNRGAPPAQLAADDITPIRSWSGRLGRQPSPADEDGKANLVAVIKGDVVRKLKDPLVVISIARGGAWDPDTAIEHDPIFFGKIGRDTVYFGFDISRDRLLSPDIRDRAYFAIYEPPARLRFGLDVGNRMVRHARPSVPAAVLNQAPPPLDLWDDLSWAHMSPGTSGYVDFSFMLPRPSQESVNYWENHKNSAGLARSFWQKPLAALLPLGRVL